MTRYEYDEAASAELHMDVVHDVQEATAPSASTWVEARRRLNTIDDRLARDLIRLHGDCGTGQGECDQVETPNERFGTWGCATTATIAHHFNIQFPDN